MIGIIDYGSGNVAAIMNILRRQRIPHVLSGVPRELAAADRYILPGVGAFDPTMDSLLRSGIVAALNEQVIGKGKHVLGICVGMHLLAEGSEEGNLPGLGWIQGRIRRIDLAGLERPKLPHMGWNSVSGCERSPLFHGIDSRHGFYFLHSYYFDASVGSEVVAHVDYGNTFPCAVERGNIFGVQFHPEKSHSNGVRILRNFAELA
ncbi:imidazole glycerol phosphate synthase subunit HisH [Sphingosinicella humi]|uniref:Imidazole glycerol phosphate synthase subunit HisH n=1 Tax=Allosphingosinicella humi TaxID=2068657 RepID=A0A2U2J183_9SPHN|nr:imidazole glycerol phosphate synthase subunit HisH [Sphingosinicella humi]PWG02096.1 imidazole glycerol phosphate synthase subunit HisH [Sphingosinicella humi]